MPALRIRKSGEVGSAMMSFGHAQGEGLTTLSYLRPDMLLTAQAAASA